MTTQQAFSLLRGLLQGVPGVACRIRLWDGSEEVIGTDPACTLVFRDEGTFTRLLTSRDKYQFAKAYVEDRFDVEGELAAALRLKNVLRSQDPGLVTKLKVMWEVGLLRSLHTRSKDQQNVQAHYDVSNAFYKLFLDTRVMAYSCAYFHREDESLEDAQEHKVDLICRKLRLKEGERLLDIGCGWGGLLIHAVKQYGVIGHGVTLSKNQYDLATQRVADAGLSDRITIELRDYRDLTDSYDKIASIGMVEHVGVRKYPEYFSVARRLLKDGGLFLNHGITKKRNGRFTSDARFIFTYIFPGAELDDINHMNGIMEDVGFETLNVECLRPHYAKTLREWSRRLIANEEHAKQLVPKDTYRAWKLYLAGLPFSFDDGGISVYQVLASKSVGEPAKVPLTPHDVY